MTMKKMTGLVILAALASVPTGTAEAGIVNLVTNGGFESLSNGIGQLGYNTGATGWTGNGYNFVYSPGTADTTGANGSAGNVQLWGPGNGAANGLTASPAGGNFVAADGAYQVGAISQTLNGLTAGNVYTVSFYWAGAQQANFNGATTEQWVVGFGKQTQSTAVVSDPNHGFTGWMQQSFNFTADGTSDVLSFLAVGTPGGEPPFSLLDGVTAFAAVPEPSTVALMGMGLVGVVAVRLRRRNKAAVA